MLQLLNISHRYESKLLLSNLNLQLADHEILCLLGESGSGKSTLLRIIAGLEKPEQGEILWNGTNIQDVPAYKRNFGLMFQDYALFPHLTVYQNIAFGLKMKKMDDRDIRKIVQSKLEQIDMVPFAHRKVTELSGGEQQRVALARALAPEPLLLMLDEPLGALDHTLRVSLLNDLKELLAKNGTSAIYVTHDHEEALTISDRVALLHEGAILQTDVPETVFRYPRSVWAARFLGQNNILTATAISGNKVEIQLGGESCFIPLQLEYPLINGQKVHLLFRDEILEIVSESEDTHSLKGVVRQSVFKGTLFEIQIEISSESIFTIYRKTGIEPGTLIQLSFNPSDLHIMLT